jgi:hypothetical protein
MERSRYDRYDRYDLSLTLPKNNYCKAGRNGERLDTGRYVVAVVAALGRPPVIIERSDLSMRHSSTGWRLFQRSGSRMLARDRHREGHMNFPQALLAAFEGKRIARAGWNGKGMTVQAQWPDANSKMREPYLYINTSPTSCIPWTVSQADLFATDWSVAS